MSTPTALAKYFLKSTNTDAQNSIVGLTTQYANSVVNWWIRHTENLQWILYMILISSIALNGMVAVPHVL